MEQQYQSDILGYENSLSDASFLRPLNVEIEKSHVFLKSLIEPIQSLIECLEQLFQADKERDLSLFLEMYALYRGECDGDAKLSATRANEIHIGFWGLGLIQDFIFILANKSTEEYFNPDFILALIYLFLRVLLQ